MKRTGTIAVAVLLWLASCGVAYGQVKLPPEIRGRTGRLIVIQAETKAKHVLFWSYDAKKEIDKADLFILGADRAGFVCAVPGKYLVLCVVSLDTGEPSIAETWVVVEGSVPVPTPTDLERKLKAAWDGETDPKKDGYRRVLVEVYRKAANVYIADPFLKAPKDLLASMEKVSLDLATDPKDGTPVLLPKDRLKATRSAISAHLGTLTPAFNSAEPFSLTDRSTYSEAFLAIAKTLEGLR